MLITNQTRYTATDLTREARHAVKATGNRRARFVRWELSLGRAQPALVAYYRIAGEDHTEHGIAIAL